jgi:hypothetical protein
MKTQLFRIFMVAFVLLVSQWVAAQTIIRTPISRPSSDAQANWEATRIITSWADSTGTPLTNLSMYRIIWNNGQEIETFQISRTAGGWWATLVPGTRAPLIAEETTERFESSPKHYCESMTVTLHITTIWYMPSSGEIVDSSNRTETYEVGGC